MIVGCWVLLGSHYLKFIEVKTMAFRALHRNARISARKVRPLADMVRNKFADEALDILRYQPQRGARMLEKVIRSALGNAQDPDQNSGRTTDVDSLVIVEVRVDEGPMFKRIRPRARGMAFMIKKRSAHIHVTLADIDEI
ncbi:MAG: large subunit ribosomal protein L22 [Pirellulaceae bacterium]|jgi:large subunit ribosomal protein L22